MFAIPMALLIVGGGLAALRNRQGVALSAVLLANWAACASWWQLTGEATTWVVLAVVDYVAALTVMIFMRVSAPMLSIIIIYAMMLLCHVAYGASDMLRQHTSEVSYFWSLTGLAWGQVAVLGGCLGVGLYRMARARADSGGGVLADGVLSGEDRAHQEARVKR